MGQLINLDDVRGHLSGEAQCIICKYIWIANAAIGTEWLECPSCHLLKGQFKYPCEREGFVWACHCQNKFFQLTPDGIYCPNCGDWQEGY